MKIEIELDVYDYNQIKKIDCKYPIMVLERIVKHGKPLKTINELSYYMKTYNMVWCSTFNSFYCFNQISRNMTKIPA